MKGIIGMHRFNICLVVVLLWCEKTITLINVLVSSVSTRLLAVIHTYTCSLLIAFLQLLTHVLVQLHHTSSLSQPASQTF